MRKKILIWLFAALPLVDSLTGLGLQWGLPSLGSAYKVALLGALLWQALRAGALRPIWVAAGVVGYLGFSVGVNLLLGGVVHTPGHPIKLGFNILTFGAMWSLWQAGEISGGSIYEILRRSAWVMTGVILIPWVLGLGSSFYAGGLGYKAFFYSGNELTVALLILFFFCLFRAAREGIEAWVQLGGITLCLLLLSTKSAMAAALLGFLALGLEYLLGRGAKHRRKVLLGTGAALVLGHRFLLRQVADFWQRQRYLFQLYGGDVLATVLSGRNYLLQDAWEAFTRSHVWLRVVIGNGFCWDKLVEMDFIDIFFCLGSLGLLALVGFFGWFFFRNLPHCRFDGTWLRPLGFLVVLAFSFLAGHTLFMATAGCYFVLMCCFFLMYRPEGEGDSP